MRSSYEYHKLLDTSRKACKSKKVINLKYDHFKNRQLTKKSLIKEYLWYNLKNIDSMVISGDYTEIIDNNLTEYYPNEPGSLKLNNVPVSYIELTLHNKQKLNLNCHLLYFCFDITSFCDVIDCILILSKNKKKNNYFTYLPFDIIRYILELISIV